MVQILLFLLALKKQVCLLSKLNFCRFVLLIIQHLGRVLVIT